MFIYIDESGIFSNPNKKQNYVSCVGALVVPENIHDELLNIFKRKLEALGFEEETKGSQLKEKQFDELISFLIKYDIIFEACAIDMGLQLEENIKNHKLIQADNFIKCINSRFNPSLISYLNNLKNRLSKLPNQLYVQSICLTQILFNVIKKSSLYYCQRNPKTLESFNWIIDRKDKTITEYENLWKEIVLPIIQTEFLLKPIDQIKEGDYTYFSRFERSENNPPDYLKEHINYKEGEFYSIDARKIIMENINFLDSKDVLGIQLIYLLITNLRRAFNNNLQVEGWNNLGKLMVQSEIGSNTIRIISLGNNINIKKLPYRLLIQLIDKKARSMLLN